MGDFTFEYGNNGELTKRTNTSTSAITLYGYDAHGNLRTVTSPSQSIQYLIDGENRRVGKKVGGSLVQGFVSDGPRVVAELNAGGNERSRFVYATGSQAPDLMIQGGVTYRLVKDHLGSVRLVVNASTGAVAQRIDFNEWGEIVSETPAVPAGTAPFQPFGFAGGIHDRDTGFVRFGARDFDPHTGRWTAKDPSRFRGGLNLYAYADNDPVNFLDPDGETPAAAMGAFAGAGGGAALGGIAATVGWGVAAVVPWVIAYQNGSELVHNWDSDVFWRRGLYAPPADFQAEHTKGARPSTIEDHQKGQARKKRDRHGEKGDNGRRENRKKPPGRKGPWPPKDPAFPWDDADWDDDGCD